MEEIFLIIWLVFILFASVKTIFLIKYFSVFDKANNFFLFPNVLMSSIFIISLMLTLKDLENLHKIVILIFTILAGITDVLGRKYKNKVMIVLSLLFYMYVVGVCWTKSFNFILPFGA